MIDRDKLKALLIERAKEAGVYSDTPEFGRHIESEVVAHLTDDDSDHEAELKQQIKLIRTHNLAMGRLPYDGYPWRMKIRNGRKVMTDGKAVMDVA